MDDAEIRRMYQWIQSRVTLAGASDAVSVAFAEPSADDFKNQEFSEEAVKLTLESAWWSEMVTDIIETPEYAEPGESAEQILQYARDVVKEYLAKRLFT